MEIGTLILSSLLNNIKMGTIKYFHVLTRWQQFENDENIKNVVDLVRFQKMDRGFKIGGFQYSCISN